MMVTETKETIAKVMAWDEFYEELAVAFHNEMTGYGRWTQADARIYDMDGGPSCLTSERLAKIAKDLLKSKLQ